MSLSAAEPYARGRFEQVVGMDIEMLQAIAWLSLLGALTAYIWWVEHWPED